MAETTSYLETYLETEEFISADEYLRRRKAGQINPADVRIAPAQMGQEGFGGFLVKLKQPRYRVPTPSDVHA